MYIGRIIGSIYRKILLKKNMSKCQNEHKFKYLKDINFRAVVIFAPRKNAKITTRENNNT